MYITFNLENFLSPAPRRNANESEANPTELLDLSPYRPRYGSHSIHRHIQFSTTEMTFIETPLVKTPKPIYEDEDDERHQIGGVI